MSNPERIIRLQTVLARTGLSRSTLYRKIAEGTFPAQVKISVHGAGWWESAINRWMPTRPATAPKMTIGPLAMGRYEKGRSAAFASAHGRE